MGLVQAVIGAIGGTLADQWKDFYTVPQGIPGTAAIFPAVSRGTDSGRGSNRRSSAAVVTNGSKFVVPEGYALLTFEDGAVTSIAAQPGGYIWDSTDPNSRSVFSGSGLDDSLLRLSWDRFKFGGRPSSQQTAVFVSLQELPNNKFGTQSVIYWDDAFLNTQAGAVARGVYSVRITDPIAAVGNFVPAAYVQNAAVFDLTDTTNQQASQLFSEVVASLASAFSHYVNRPDKQNRITRIQQDTVGFSSSLAASVESAFGWSKRGLRLEKAALTAVDYDEATRSVIAAVQRADALLGDRGNSNLQASVAEGIQSAGLVGGSAGILGLGIAAGSLGLGDLQQRNASTKDAGGETNSTNRLARLSELKQALDQGLITQADYDAAKGHFLGSS